jgi:hypothetical protein
MADQQRLAALVASLKQTEQDLVANSVVAGGSASGQQTDEAKLLSERIARAVAALNEATTRTNVLTEAAKPTDRNVYVVSNVGTLRVVEPAQ